LLIDANSSSVWTPVTLVVNEELIIGIDSFQKWKFVAKTFSSSCKQYYI